MHIDGEFNGDIHSTNTIEVGKTGVLKSEIKAQKLVVAGKFHGNADCESIELLSGGEVVGKLTTTSLSVDSGSSFQGESVRKRPDDDTTVVELSAESNPFKSKPGERKGASGEGAS